MEDKTKKVDEQPKLNLRGAELPTGYTLDDLREQGHVAKTEYSSSFNRARKLDAADSGELWDAVAARFPSYQLLPDSNWVSYVKDNLLASLYTVGKDARIMPTSEDDKELVEFINIALAHIWNILDVPSYQLQAGERAALLNLGVTQIGWDSSTPSGTSNNLTKGEVVLKNIDPLRFMRDPYSDSLDTASYCMTWDTYHKSVIKSVKDYQVEFANYLRASQNTLGSSEFSDVNYDRPTDTGVNKKDYYTIVTHWVNDDGKIHEIHTVNDEWVLFVKEDIKPSMFPFAELYCNVPTKSMFGVSNPCKIFKNNLTYNIMSSMVCTAEYKNQRPPRFVNGTSGLNVANFIRNGNDADRTFVVSGDAEKAVHYHQFPVVSQQSLALMNLLGGDIQKISGVDGSYTGRDTGSILTTGGIDSMLDQATMIDAPKVANYEKYCRRLTQLVIYNYIQHANAPRSYFVKDTNTQKWKSVTVPFGDIPKDVVFDYEINISSILPKNRSRLEAFGNKVMQMQMQYKAAGIDVDLITPEEWLMFQDNPYREYMLGRMGMQRSQNYKDMVAKVIGHYVDLTDAGTEPLQAMEMTADVLAKEGAPGGEGAMDEQLQAVQEASSNAAPPQDLTSMSLM